MSILIYRGKMGRLFVDGLSCQLILHARGLRYALRGIEDLHGNDVAFGVVVQDDSGFFLVTLNDFCVVISIQTLLFLS